MALNPNGMANTNWNCTKPDKEGYSLELTGTVVSLQEVQARHFNPSGAPGAPRFWDNGDPVWNIRVGLATQDGSLKSIVMAEAGKAQREGRKPSLHMQLFNLTNKDITQLIGQTIHIWTWPAHPQTGQQWGQGNPRLYGVELVQGVRYELAEELPAEFKVPKLLANDGASGGQPTPAQPQQVVVPQQVPQYMPPQPQPLAQQASMTPQPQPQPQPQMAPQPQPQAQVQGVDPVVAQAMQSVQPTAQAAPVNQVPTDVYEDMIPF